MVQNGVAICGYNYDCMKNKTKILLVVTADILVLRLYCCLSHGFIMLNRKNLMRTMRSLCRKNVKTFCTANMKISLPLTEAFKKPRIPIAAAMYPLRF